MEEAESKALREAVATRRRRASSSLARVELARTLRRLGREPREGRQAIRSLSLIALTDDVLDLASDLEPSVLRSLDALHLASALSIGDGVDAFLTYDQRLARAAELAGLDVETPC